MTPSWQLRDQTLDLERPVGVGIVNVTDDSMFEGARSGTPQQAIEDGVALAKAGFDMLDLGALAARSGPPVPARDEAERLVPALEGLSARMDLPLSADTFSPEVAGAALDAGAVAVNDIGRQWGVRAGELVRTAAQALGGGGGGKDDVAQGVRGRAEAVDAVVAGERVDVDRDRGERALAGRRHQRTPPSSSGKRMT